MSQTKQRHYLIVVLIVIGFLALLRWQAVINNPILVDGSANEQILPKESHFKNLRQLTFGGENAEAYFSSDSKKTDFSIPRWPRSL